MTRDELLSELNEAVEELVSAVEATAQRRQLDAIETLANIPTWVLDVHGETVDVRTVEDAADNIANRLEEGAH